MPRHHVTFLFLLALLVGPLGGAQAAPIFFGFSLKFSSGPLAGQSFAGTLSVDGNDCAGPCSGTFTPSSTPKTLLTFDVTVGGISYDMNDDADFPDFPEVELQNDVVIGVDFLSEGTPLLTIGYSSAANFVEFVPSEGPSSAGKFAPGNGSTVPEPGTVGLLGLGLAGLAASRRRKQ